MTYIDPDGSEINATIRLISTEPSESNWLAVNQVTLQTSERKRRFDVALYCNGMPVSIIELKRAGSEAATVTGAHTQLQTYLREFPRVFRF
ncbi:type I restriction endonuclease [Arthrobacter pigmenti]